MKTTINYTEKYNGYRGPEQYAAVLSYKHAREMVAAAKHPEFMHARFRLLCGVERVLVYVRDRSSPTGRILAGGGPAALMDRLIRKYQKTSALSPSEMLGC